MIPFHHLRKLADVIQIIHTAANFHMVIVNIPAGPVDFLSVRRLNADFSAVRNTEQFFVTGINKPDAFLCLTHVMFQELTNISVNMEIVLSFDWVAPKHIDVLGGLQFESILCAAAAHHFGLWMPLAELAHTVPAEKQPVFLPQSIDHFIKLGLELIGFVLPMMIEP